MTNHKAIKTKGLAALTSNPSKKTTKPNFNNNSSYNQRLKILDWLLEKGSITTSEARQHLDILHPAGRVRELKEAGYLIVTIWDSWTSEHGIKHPIGRYVLTQKQPIDCEVA